MKRESVLTTRSFGDSKVTTSLNNPAVLDGGAGHFETIQRFSEQFDFAVLCDQSTKKELMYLSSRFARHRRELVFGEDLFWGVDQNLNILEIEIRIEIAHKSKKPTSA